MPLVKDINDFIKRWRSRMLPKLSWQNRWVGAPQSGQGDQICCEYLSTENRNYTAQTPSLSSFVLRDKNHLGAEAPAKTLEFEISSASRVVKKARRHFSR